jgi:hypothetical protein
MPAQTVIQLRRDTSANWESADPILASGEAGFDTTENKIKIGDGTSTWTELDYASGGSGSITVSETAPADPAEGDLWFNSTNAVTYIYYDSFWVELTPAIAGPEGPIGEPGIVVQDEEPTNTDVLWLDSDDPADAVAVPAGGETGQVLAKATGDDYDTEWTTLPEAPTPVSSGNAIINGAFEINQRNFSSSTSAGYNFDRWNTVALGNGTNTVSRQSFSPGDTPDANFQSPNFFRHITTGQSSADVRSSFNQPIESVRTFAGQTVTLSFYAKSASGTPNIAVEYVQNFGAGGSSSVFVTPQKVAISTTWTRYSVTTAIPSISGKTIGSDTNQLILLLWFSAGSDANARTDSLGIQSNTFDIWGVQLEAGSTATPFKRNANSIQGELAACQRYYVRYAAELANYYIGGRGNASSTTNVVMQYPIMVEMRTKPSAIDFSALSVYDEVSAIPVSTATVAVLANSKLLQASLTCSGATQFRSYTTVSQGGSVGFIGISAEL